MFCGEKSREIEEILREPCNWNKIKIIEAEVCPGHIPMLVEIPPKVAVSSFAGFLKGKSSLPLYGKFPELKYKCRAREFWCRGYYVDMAGKKAIKIAEHIKHQLDEDKGGERLTMMKQARLRAAGSKTFAAGGPYLCDLAHVPVS